MPVAQTFIMNEGGIATEGLKYRVGKRVSRMAICTSVTLLGLSLLVFLPSTIDELLKNGASFFAILGLFFNARNFLAGFTLDDRVVADSTAS